MNAKEISAILSANGIKPVAGFSELDKLGYIAPEYRELSNEMLRHIEALIEHGVNNTFNKSMQSAIEKLTQMCMALTTRNSKAQKVYPKLKNDFVEIKASTALTSKREEKPIKENTVKQIEMDIRGLEFLRDRYASDEFLIDADKADRLAEKDREIAKLKELRSVVMSALDNSSMGAAKLADEILDNIADAAEIINAEQDNDTVFEKYDEAIAKAKKWASRTIAVGKNEVAKEAPQFSPGSDHLSVVALSVDAQRDAERFRANLARYKQSREGHDQVVLLEKQRKSCEDKIKELNEKKKGYFFAAQSGTMSKADLAQRCKAIDQEIALHTKKIANYNAQIQKSSGGRLVAQEVFEKLEFINQILEFYENDRVKLYQIGRKINFVTLTKLMRGETLSQEEKESVAHAMKVIKIVPLNTQESYNSAFESFRDIEETIDAALPDLENPLDAALSLDELNQAEQEGEEYFAQMAAELGISTDQPAMQQSEESPLRDPLDDLLNN